MALVAIVLPRVADRRGFVLPPAARYLGLSSLTVARGLLTVPPVLVAAYLNLTDANSGTSIAHQPKALLLWLGHPGRLPGDLPGGGRGAGAPRDEPQPCLQATAARLKKHERPARPFRAGRPFEVQRGRIAAPILRRLR